VYISRDVVFDEHVFPFASLHPNAGARLRAKIALLPNILLNPNSSFGDARIRDQHLISSNQTNVSPSGDDVLAGTGGNSKQNASNPVQNGVETGSYLLCPSRGSSTRFEIDPLAHVAGSAGESSPGSAPGLQQQLLDSAAGSPSGSSTPSSLNPESPAQGAASQLDPGTPSEADSVTGSGVAGQGSGVSAGSSVSPVSTPPPPPQRPVTRLMQGVGQPKQRTDGTVRWLLTSVNSSKEPMTLQSAVSDKKWVDAMDAEYQAL
jgi:hypothetical protein